MLAASCLSPLARATGTQDDRTVRVAAVFLAQVRNSWPYPGFDAAARQREILAVLSQACPDVEFLPVTIRNPEDMAQALSLGDQVDGYFVYVATLSWALRGALAAISQLNKPMVVATEFLGGCGAFLTGAPPLVRNAAAVAVSTTRLEDLAAVAREFATLRTPGVTPAEFAQRCEIVYRGTFPLAHTAECTDDNLQLADIGQCIARFRTSKVLVPGFVSDPAIDTSQNRIVYSHCVGPTKVFGPQGPQNGYQIRTSHARIGAVLESLMPAGYMTTTFRTNVARKQMVIHQARSLGPLASEKGCRTKLIGEVRGDIGKMFTRWDQFEWHRVTVFGDLQEPLTELGKALGLEVIAEA